MNIILLLCKNTNRTCNFCSISYAELHLGISCAQTLSICPYDTILRGELLNYAYFVPISIFVIFDMFQNTENSYAIADIYFVKNILTITTQLLKRKQFALSPERLKQNSEIKHLPCR